MLKDEYLYNISDNYKAPLDSKAKRILERFKGLILKWGGVWIDSINIIGSAPQGTSIKKVSGLDVDLFVSIVNDAPYTLAEMHKSLKEYFNKNGKKTTTRNFAMKTKVDDISVDIVVARRFPGVKGIRDGFHEVYSTKTKKIVPSNPRMHTQLIRKSGKQDVIRIAKRWLIVHEVEMPSFLMTLVVLEATKKLTIEDGLYKNFRRVLEYISKEFMYVMFVDPANTKDNLSEQMTNTEVLALVRQANESLKQKDLSEVVW